MVISLCFPFVCLIFFNLINAYATLLYCVQPDHCKIPTPVLFEISPIDGTNHRLRLVEKPRPPLPYAGNLKSQLPCFTRHIPLSRDMERGTGSQGLMEVVERWPKAPMCRASGTPLDFGISETTLHQQQ